MKYVILIHANPDPWGHPSALFTPEGRALPKDQHEEMDRQFDALLEEISKSGEFVSAEALGDPAESTLYGWSPEGHIATDGPYAETKEQIGGILILEARDLNHAIQLMSKHPGVKAGPFEIRPAEDLSEMIRESEQRRAGA